LSIAVSPAPLAVTKISPSTGSISGFSFVRIEGANLLPAGQRCFVWSRSCGATVFFGTRQATVLYATPTSISVLSPPGTGTVDVTVVVNGVPSPTGPADLFTYVTGHRGFGGRGRG